MDRKIERGRWATGRIATLVVVILFLALAVYIFVFSDKGASARVEKDRITLCTVRYRLFEESIPVIGSVQPLHTVYLDVTEGGSVVKKYLEEGAHVNVGDPIVQLDNTELRLSIIYNEANVFQQINALRSTKLSFAQNALSLRAQLLDLQYKIINQKRIHGVNRALHEKGLISDTEFRQSEDQLNFLMEGHALTLRTFVQDSLFREEQVKQLEASVKTLEENLGITKRQLSNLIIRSPIRGQLTSLGAEVGQSKSRGENIGQIDAVDSFKVRAAIDELYIRRVRVGQTASLSVGNMKYRLRVSTVYPEVKEEKFQIDMLFVDAIPDDMRRGQALHITLNLSEMKQALLVERGSFFQSTGGQWIYLVDPSGSYADRRVIKLGMQNSQTFEVVDGLNEGDVVIVSSYEEFGEAQRVVLR